MQVTMTSYVGIEKTCPLYLGVCHGNYKLFSQHAGVRWSRISTSDLKGASSICTATSISHKWNPDFPKQSKIYSRGGGRGSQQKETSGSIEEGDPLSSKNGTSPPVSTNRRYHSAAPGQREMEIVELFRKVQAQLRGKAPPPKSAKKVEAPQLAEGERGTVESLLQLLRKHTVDQGKNKGSDGSKVNLSESSSGGSKVNHSQRTNSSEEEPNSSLLETESFTSSGVVQDPIATRPVSNFQRKSPVPRVKYQPVYSAEENDATDSLLESRRMGKKETATTETDMEPLFFDEAEDEFDDESASPSDLDEVEDEIIEQVSTESCDLNSLKISELRELAKSRGMKGYSRLKKVELVKMLGGGGI